MDLTEQQWERLQMMVSNPAREGIDTIVLKQMYAYKKYSDDKVWVIEGYNSKEVIGSPELGAKDDR